MYLARIHSAVRVVSTAAPRTRCCCAPGDLLSANHDEATGTDEQWRCSRHGSSRGSARA
jgi:hypothetical protein